MILLFIHMDVPEHDDPVRVRTCLINESDMTMQTLKIRFPEATEFRVHVEPFGQIERFGHELAAWPDKHRFEKPTGRAEFYFVVHGMEPTKISNQTDLDQFVKDIRPKMSASSSLHVHAYATIQQIVDAWLRSVV